MSTYAVTTGPIAAAEPHEDRSQGGSLARLAAVAGRLAEPGPHAPAGTSSRLVAELQASGRRSIAAMHAQLGLLELTSASELAWRNRP